MKVAIIFAAGSGTRLRPLTHEIHKSLIKFNDVPLIEHTINNLLQVPELTKIIVITGYLENDFKYLTIKYSNLTLVHNKYYLDYDSGYALKLVEKYFDGNSDIFIISGDMVSTINHFNHEFDTNVMFGVTRDDNDKKDDWTYELSSDGNIIDIIKSHDANSLLAGEWSYVNKLWAKKLGQDLHDPEQVLVLKTTLVGKYLINNSIKHHMILKSYVLDFNSHWDIDNIKDLERTNKYFK
ncbi:sugar phosphate nucleotidyltransferase [Spiroplasma endosymbiont of Virgichneumon dumeticola]|uniref:sugar phosphate nucleotidyltransferase n=1 Tax=Spiroplasma endosymbiont of Virgichneumon dumeticola TaxID=3139323 RepID=UPI0035C92757